MFFRLNKEELQTFCRENGISTSGSKIEITDRIAAFLQTGEIQKSLKKRNSPKYKKQIGSQFEYNQFIRDYFADPKNKGNHREDAIKA